MKAYKQLYHPPFDHESILSGDEDDNVRRIKVAGVVVRYREDSDSVHVTVEGNLSENTLNALGKDLVGKMTDVERAPCELVKSPQEPVQRPHPENP